MALELKKGVKLTKEELEYLGEDKPEVSNKYLRTKEIKKLEALGDVLEVMNSTEDIGSLEKELARRKRLLEYVKKEKGTTPKQIKKLEDNIKLTEKAIVDLEKNPPNADEITMLASNALPEAEEVPEAPDNYPNLSKKDRLNLIHFKEELKKQTEALENALKSKNSSREEIETSEKIIEFTKKSIANLLKKSGATAVENPVPAETLPIEKAEKLEKLASSDEIAVGGQVSSSEGDSYEILKTPDLDQNKDSKFYVVKHLKSGRSYKYDWESLKRDFFKMPSQAETLAEVTEQAPKVKKENAKSEQEKTKVRIAELEKIIAVEKQELVEIENELDKIKAAREDEETRRVTQELAERIETFSKIFLGGVVQSLLESPKAKEKIDRIIADPEFSGIDNELVLKTTIEKSGFDIGVTATFDNEKDGIVVKNWKIDAMWPAKKKSENALGEYIDKIPGLVKTHIEENDKKNRKVEKMWIEGGALKVLFKKEEKVEEKVLDTQQNIREEEFLKKWTKLKESIKPHEEELEQVQVNSATPASTPATLEPAPANPVEPISIFTPTNPEAINLEKTLDEARAKYAEAYKEFMASANIAVRGARFVFGTKIKDSKIPPELKNLEAEYDQAAAKYGQAMFDEKSNELSKKANEPGATITSTEISDELKRFKQGDIFTRVIVQEQSMLNALKVENLPPKERGLVKKSLDLYLKQPRWKKIAISTVLGTVAVAALSSSSAVTAGGLAAYAGTRAVKTFVGSTMTQGVSKAINIIFKEKSSVKRAKAEKELAEKFKEESFDTSIAKGKKEYAEILEREQRAKRNRLITKAMASLAVGGLTSYGMGHMFGHTPDQLHTSGANENQQYDVTKMLRKANAKIHEAEGKTLPDTKATLAPETVPVKPDDMAVIHKGEGIEHTFRRQIEHDPELAKSLGFKGDINDAKALHKFSGHEADVIARKMGYVDKNGEVRITEANKIAFELKAENGHAVVTEKTLGGEELGKHGEGGKEYEFGKTPDNQYQKVVDTTHHKTVEQTITETPEINTEAPKTYISEFNSRHGLTETPETSTETHARSVEEISEKIKAQMGPDNSITGKINDQGADWRVNNTTPIKENPIGIYKAAKMLENEPEFANNPYLLSGEELLKINKIHHENISEIFEQNKFKLQAWDKMKVLKVANLLDEKDYELNPFLRYVHKLRDVTGIEPKSGFLGFGKEPTGKYIARALQASMKMGKLEEVEASLNK
jgi:hypothetical protein